MEVSRFMQKLKIARPRLTKQQYRTLKGQALNGDVLGAQKGLEKLRERNRL